MDPNSFQARFGALVKRHRVKHGLTQLDVAAKVYRDETKASRVSDVERGRHEPQAQTVADYRLALAIPQEELDGLTAPSTPPPMDHDLIERIREEMDLSTNGLLENLAQRFGIDNPDAPRAKLESFLKDKAKEWQALRERLASLTELDERLSNQMAAAEDALSRGDFDQAEDILSAAEEIQQQERTLAQVRKQSQIRATRAEAALLKGDQDQAFEHFKASANMFDPFDPLEGARVRHEHYVALYQTGLQFPGTALTHAADLARANLSAYADPAHTEDRGKTLNNLAIFLQSQGIRTEGSGGAKLLAEAVKMNRAALKIRDRDAKPADWAMTQNNLGLALQSQGIRTEGPESVSLLAEAVQAYREDLAICIEIGDQIGAATTQNNLGAALRYQGSRTEGQEGAALLAQAVQAYRAALKVHTRDAMPGQWATTQSNLGTAFRNQGERTVGQEGDALLSQALASYRAALQIRTRDATPVYWATTQEGLGLAFEAMAGRAQDATSDDKLTQALTHLDAALEVFDRGTMSFQYQECSKGRDRVAAKLAGTWVE